MHIMHHVAPLTVGWDEAIWARMEGADCDEDEKWGNGEMDGGMDWLVGMAPICMENEEMEMGNDECGDGGRQGGKGGARKGGLVVGRCVCVCGIA